MNFPRLLTRLLQLFAVRALWRASRPTRPGPTTGARRNGAPGPARAQREAAKRARQAARITRRLGR